MRVERQLSIDELSEHLGLPRSTIYYWVRDLPIHGSGSGGAWAEAARRKGTRAMQRKYRVLRDEAYVRGKQELDGLLAEPTFRDFVCLYIAEGSKRDRNVVAICNSDPAVMRVATRWIRLLAEKVPTFWIQFHADQDPADLCAFWQEALAIEPGTIKLQRKSNSNQLTGRIWRSRYGVMTVRAADTLLRARLQAWMDLVRDDWQ